MYFFWISDLLESLYDVVNGVLGGLFYWLSKHIYSWICSLYKIFLAISKSRLLDNDVVRMLANRIGLLLGIVMFFIIIISMIQMLVDPDKLNDKEKGVGPILMRAVLVVVMFGVSSFVFDSLYYIQNVVIDSGVINNLLLPYSVQLDDDYGDDEVDKFGNSLAYNLFIAFYSVDEKLIESGDSDAMICNDIIEDALLHDVVDNNDFSAGDECLRETTSYNGTTVDVMKFDGILLLLTGIVVVYFLFTYCISVGMRMIQLTFLEIMSPMAFVSYLSPKKDNMFSRWCKIYFATFIDVFIRIAIISFVTFLINVVFQEFSDGAALWSANSPLAGFDGFAKDILMVILVIALLSFAKKAPELIKDLFPSTGASKLGFGIGMSGFAGLGALFGGAASLGIATVGRAAGLIGSTGKAVGLIKNTWDKNLSFKDNIAANKANFGNLGKKFATGLGGMAGAMVTGTFRGAAAGYSSKGVGAALKAGQQSQSKANLAYNQRVASGKTIRESAEDAAKGFFGIDSAYKGFDSALSMSNGVKTILEGEDPIKRLDEMRQSYVQACAAKGVAPLHLDVYDDAKKSMLRQMYNHAYNHDNGDVPASLAVTLKDADGNDFTYNDSFESNMGIHRKIRVNEKRSGKQLSNWDAYKADNNEIKNKIAKTTKNN